MSTTQRQDSIGPFNIVAPSGGVTVNVPIQIGSLLVVPLATAAEGADVAVTATGIHDLPAKTSQAWTLGAALYWDTDEEHFTTVATANTGAVVGEAAAAKGASAATGSVRLDGTSATDAPADAQDFANVAAALAAADAAIEVNGQKISDLGTPAADTDAATKAYVDDTVADGGNLADDSVPAAKLNVFKSTEQTGTGSEQDIAHGLGAVPGLVIVTPTSTPDAATFAEGTHDGTNVKVTATSGAKFKVVAIV